MATKKKAEKTLGRELAEKLTTDTIVKKAKPVGDANARIDHIIEQLHKYGLHIDETGSKKA